MCKKAKGLSLGDAYQLVGASLVGASSKQVAHLMSFLDELDKESNPEELEEDQLDVADYLAYENERQGIE